MKFLFPILAALMLLVSACSTENKYEADKHLTEVEKSQLLLTTIRYMGHLPKKGTQENKFDADFDEHYSTLAKEYTVEAYHQKDDYEYVLTTRIAPSLKEKKIAIGVKMQRNANGELTYYEEVFRTWKFEVPEMKEKGFMLFDKMVKGEDLSPYYPQNSGKEEFIEFPDQKVTFDIKERRWIMKGMDLFEM
ncbi:MULTISPECIES: hypothetical protein [Rhodonellum]|nr:MULTISPECIES: hypothetical protein [Rhodonellum]SDY46028.1 hypothetical protein SAMN05444412_101220 [Rhodonellum ikkaensis]